MLGRVISQLQSQMTSNSRNSKTRRRRSFACQIADTYFPATMSTELPKPVVFCGPSGVGKGTLIDLLMKRFPEVDGQKQFGFSVSHTTRDPRPGEEDGVAYNFTTVDAIKKEIDAGKFLEYAEVHGNYYGTSVDAVASVQKKGLICVLDIDAQGVRNVKKSSLDPYYLFIAPPSMGELEKRLRGRGTEKEESIQKRLANAKAEMEYGQTTGEFDKYLVNSDLDATFEELVETFKAWYPSLTEVAPDDEPKPSCNAKCVVS